MQMEANLQFPIMSIYIIDISGGSSFVSEFQHDVLIVGGGFSGAMLAANLLRRSSTLSVAVMDR